MSKPRFEHRCRETFAWYACYVVDYLAESNEVVVRFADDWKEPLRAPPEDVRPCPDDVDLEKWSPVEGEQVEAKARSEENQPFGWWPCTVRCIKNDFYLINFDGWNDTYNEILMKDMLRPRNRKGGLANAHMEVADYVYKEGLHDWVQTHPEEITSLTFICGLFSLHINEGSIKLLGSKKTVRKTQTLLDIISAQRMELMELEVEVNGNQTKIKVKQKALSDACCEEFVFLKENINFVIGKGGRNINQAKQVEGIVKIKVDEDQSPPKCIIWAKREYPEALEQARDILEIVRKKFAVPPEAMGRIIGSKGSSIKEIIKKSQVKFIRSWETHVTTLQNREVEIDEKGLEGEELESWNSPKFGEYEIGEKNTFVIVGSRESVDTAVEILKFKLKHFEKLNQLSEERRNTQSKLRELNEQVYFNDGDRRQNRRNRNYGRGRGGGDNNRGGGRYRRQRREQERNEEGEDNRSEQRDNNNNNRSEQRGDNNNNNNRSEQRRENNNNNRNGRGRGKQKNKRRGGDKKAEEKLENAV